MALDKPIVLVGLHEKPNVSNFSDLKGVPVPYYFEINHSQTQWLQTPVSFIISYGSRTGLGSARHLSIRVSHVVLV